MAAFIAALPVRSPCHLFAGRPLRQSLPMSSHARGRVRLSSLSPLMSAATPSDLPRKPSRSPVRPPAGVTPKTALPRGYRAIRTRIFLTMLISYATYYIARSTFPFTAPLMQTELNLTLQQVGLISSCFPAAYGISKLFAGILADVRPPRTIISLGLLLAGLANVVFAMGSSVPHFAVLWALTGVVSSLGFPACAKLLSTWFAPGERGTYWGMLNVSLNLGAAVSPIFVAAAATRFGWRFGLLLPAGLAVAMASVAYLSIVDTPQAANLPKTDLLPQSPKRERSKNGLRVVKEQLLGGVLSEPAVWLLAAAYFFVYVMRQALSSWTVFYLLQGRGVTSLAEAGIRVSGLEVGGLVGSVSAGWISDRLIRGNKQAGAIGLRVRVVLGYVILTAVAASLFFATPASRAWLPVQWTLFALTGMGLYGPQLLVGLCGAECVDARFSGTSNGFVGLAAYVGAALAGLPLSLLVRRCGWGGLQGVVVGCCAVVAVLLLPLMRKRSHEQTVAAAGKTE